MKVVYKVKQDGTFDFSDSIETDTIIEGYAEPDPDKHYKDDGTEMTEAEVEAIRNAPQPESPTEVIARLEAELADTKTQLAIAQDVAAETSVTQQQLIELLIDLEVI